MTLADDAQQIVGRERRERLSQLAWCGGGCFDARLRVNSDVRCHLMKPPKGLKISQIRPGDGPFAELGKYAVIRYDCYLPRGETCDSSRNQPYPVQLKVGER